MVSSQLLRVRRRRSVNGETVARRPGVMARTPERVSITEGGDARAYKGLLVATARGLSRGVSRRRQYERGRGRKLGLERFSGQDGLHQSQTLEDRNVEIFQKIDKISGSRRGLLNDFFH